MESSALATDLHRTFRFPKSDKVNVRAHSFGQDWDEQARRCAIDACGSFDRAIDIGAHVGIHASFLQQRFFHVDAFEPQPECFDCLTSNVVADGVSIHRISLGRKSSIGYVRRSSERDSTETVFKPGPAPDLLRVPIATLDSYGWQDVGLIHFGTSQDWGAVLAGATRTLMSRPVLWVTARDPAALGRTLAGLLPTFVTYGYRCIRAQDENYVFAVDTSAQAPANDLRPGGDARLLAGLAEGDRLVIAHDAALVSDPDDMWGLLDHQVAPAVSRRIGTRQGPIGITAYPVPPNAELKAPLRYVLPQGAEGSVKTLAPRMAIEEIVAETALGFSAMRLTIDAPELLMAACDRILVHAELPGEPARLIFRRPVDRLANVNAIHVDVPAELVRESAIELTVSFLRAEYTLHRVGMSADLVREHIAPDSVNCFLNLGGGGNPAVRAMAKSLGARTPLAENGFVDGVAFVWGVLRGSKDVIDAAIARGGIFYYMDHAYFGRGHLNNYRITRNRFEAGAVRECPDDRLALLDVRPKAWRKGGNRIIVCPPTDYFKQAHDCHDWLERTLAELALHTDREIVIREKPVDGSLQPLEEAVLDAHALVTHSSNVAIEAAVLGCPVFVSAASAARPIGLSDLTLIETPAYPDRQAWLNHLAYSQFAYDEILSGAAWDMLKEFERRPFA